MCWAHRIAPTHDGGTYTGGSRRMAVMDKDRLRVINQKIRETHLKFYASQGKEIDALREALDALKESNELIQQLLKQSDDLDAEIDAE